MNPNIPLPDVAWTLLATAAVTAMVCLAAMWLVDNALLPALRGLLHPARPWLERRFPPTGDHRIKETQDVLRPGPGSNDPIGTGEAVGPEHPEDELPDLAGPEPEWPALPDDEETLAVLHAANQEHLVPTHEPDADGPERSETASGFPSKGEGTPRTSASRPSLDGPVRSEPPAGEDVPPVARREPPAGPGASFRRLVWEGRDTEQRLARASCILGAA